MDHREIRTLKLLNIFASNRPVSQRELSRELRVSVGSVNTFLKALVNEGLCRIANKDNKRLEYRLTRKGFQERGRLTYKFYNASVKFYKDQRKKFKSILTRLHANGVKRVALFGSGYITEIGWISVMESPIQLVAIIDDDAAGKEMLKERVYGAEKLKEVKLDRLIISNNTTLEECQKKLAKINLEDLKIVKA